MRVNKQAAKAPLSFETTVGGFQYISRNPNLEVKPDKPANASAGNYIPSNKRNSSMEDYNFKSNINASKGHKRSNQDQKKGQITMNGNISKWEESGSTSPNNNPKSKYTRDKLK